MDFHKVETTSNFVFGPPEARNLVVTDYGSSVFRITLEADRWPRGTDSQAVLTPLEFGVSPSTATVYISPQGEIRFSTEGKPVLESKPGRGFGVCGPKWVFAFAYREDYRFYGMGEKHLGFELSNQRTKFWNTDVLGEFPVATVVDGRPDPSYSTFPVLIVKAGDLWAAVIIDNPHGVFVNTGAGEAIFQPLAAPFNRELFFGSRDGAPDLWLLADPTPAGLVRKVQSLQGRVPPPPLWALGHHQCRWGYKGYEDLKRVADGFEARGIPNDGLWLDIDYMDGYRVFTVDQEHFDDVASRVAEFKERGFRVVPILDPGLRQDQEYAVYAEAKDADLLCQTPEGTEYVGFVWPGYTVFPDFSLPETRDFWAWKVKEFTDFGFGGYWIDMNDPSTGSVPHGDMLFGRGTRPHSAYHNQYALGMAEGTRRGLQASRPKERPFLVSRSAYLSSGRYTALWTGDNVSNEHHLRNTLALSLNLSVSGMPFNGPDVPGFFGDASNELMQAWYKAGFLFPFLRNHKVLGGLDQEPWSRDARTTQVVGDYIRLRYKFLPYLYQTFLNQTFTGDPVLRPVWYHDPSPAFDRTDDLFFVGSSVLQGPFTTLADKSKSITLPRHHLGDHWYDVENTSFVRAGQPTSHKNTPRTTPLFLASPSAIPFQRGVRTTNRNDLGTIDLLVVLDDGESAVLDYNLDDGLTESWRDGVRSRFTLVITTAEGQATATLANPERGFGGLNLRILLLTPGKINGLTFNGQPFGLRSETLDLAGKGLPVAATVEIEA